MIKIRTAPQQERPDPHKARRGFTFDLSPCAKATAIRATQSATFDVQYSQRVTTRAIQSPQKISMLNINTTPQRERSDTPKVRKGFTHQLFSEFAQHHSESTPSKDQERLKDIKLHSLGLEALMYRFCTRAGQVENC